MRIENKPEPERAIDIDWRHVRPFKAPGRLVASRADAAIRVAFPDATAIWRARVSSSSALDWEDGAFLAASSVTDGPLSLLIDTIDGLRLGGWIPRTYYLIEQDSGMKYAVVTKHSVRLYGGLTGPDLAGEYHNESNAFAKTYCVK